MEPKLDELANTIANELGIKLTEKQGKIPQIKTYKLGLNLDYTVEYYYLIDDQMNDDIVTETIEINCPRNEKWVIKAQKQSEIISYEAPRQNVNQDKKMLYKLEDQIPLLIFKNMLSEYLLSENEHYLNKAKNKESRMYFQSDFLFFDRSGFVKLLKQFYN